MGRRAVVPATARRYTIETGGASSRNSLRGSSELIRRWSRKNDRCCSRSLENSGVSLPEVLPSRSHWAALLAASMLAAACAKGHGSDVVVLVDSGQTQPPEYLTFTWLACNDVLVRDRRVPAQGSLPASANPIASI